MRRFAVAIFMALGLLAVPVTAAATEPIISHYTQTADVTISGVCAFDLAIHATIQVTEIDYFDNSGVFVRVYLHATEQDTFTGPGGSLTSVPYTYNVEAQFDSNGDTTSWVVDGVVLRIPLPNGKLFVSAGKINVLNHRGTQFFISPDFGRSGNLTAFCAALA
jgi:hypothetical protein